MNEPLANILRPTKLKEILGQKHLIGENKVISNLVKNKKLFSMILYGNPGIGKTTIALCIVNELNLKYRMLNAVINNKKDFDIVVSEAKMYKGLIVIMDEIHRMNKDKQDLLLPYLESGLITIIGLTSSNPYHSINKAIRSRCQIFELESLDKEDVIKGLKRAKKHLPNIKCSNKVLELIAANSNGDIRASYNTLELAYYSTLDFVITEEVLKNISNKPIFYSDKDEDAHYDVLSGFQKSIRGSDVNASLHYLAKLIITGDYDSIFRRMTVIAYEDIGLANPSMGPKVHACIESCNMIGFPEARIMLSSVVIELCLSPKSNSSEAAIDAALADLNNADGMPLHLKNGSTKYIYPHNYKNAFVKQQYMPNSIKDHVYYTPRLTSNYEKQLANVYEKLKELQK